MTRRSGGTIRPLRDGELEAVRALNAANVPAVGPLDEGRVALFRARATWLVAVDDVGDGGRTVVATFVGLREGIDYDSPNYAWFGERHARFAYVDRIVVAPAGRGTGIADALYTRWFAAAAADVVPVVCAEVNVVPPNERSLAFHRRHGFEVVGEQVLDDGEHRVAMLVRHTGPGDRRPADRAGHPPG